MAVPSVTAQNTRIDASDTASTLVNIGGGAGPGGEPDILYQGSGGTPEDTSRKVGTGQSGFANTPSPTDISTGTGTYQTLLMKYNAANFAALELISVPGIELRLGSAASAYALYDVQGSDTYPAKGGFIIQAIDPNISGYRTSTQGSPAFTAADYFGITGDFTATSKSENLVMSAIDVGDGLTLIGGDGADPDAVWEDFSDFDTGTLANRYGYFVPLEGISGLFGVFGTMVIGSSANETDFTDSDVTTVFLDGFFEAGWSGVDVNLENSNSVFSNTNHTYDSRGNTTTTDTRAVYNVTGTSGTATETTPTFKSFAEINLNSAMRFDGGRISNSGTVDINGADIRTLTISDSTGTSAALWNVASDPDGEIDNVTFNSSGTGHGLELGTSSPLTINLRGVKFNNYAGVDGSTGNEAIWVRRGSGTVTINILNGGDTPTIRTDGATVNVINAVIVRVTVLDASDSTVVSGARVLLEAAAGGDLTIGTDILDGTTNVSGIIEDTGFAFTNDQPVTGKVRKGTNTPLYRQSPISGTITTNGFETTIFLVSDE